MKNAISMKFSFLRYVGIIHIRKSAAFAPFRIREKMEFFWVVLHVSQHEISP